MASASVANLDMKLEVVVIPVSNVDQAKEFYMRLGWRLDADRAAGNNFRLVQFTPPGSSSSVQFGVNLTSATPGSAQGLLLIVSDIEAARQQLVMRGIDANEVFHCETGTACRFPPIIQSGSSQKTYKPFLLSARSLIVSCWRVLITQRCLVVNGDTILKWLGSRKGEPRNVVVRLCCPVAIRTEKAL
jgi:hypothetical protein